MDIKHKGEHKQRRNLVKVLPGQKDVWARDKFREEAMLADIGCLIFKKIDNYKMCKWLGPPNHSLT